MAQEIINRQIDQINSALNTLGQRHYSLGTALKAAFDSKANTDGYYDTLTAGNAEQLVSTVGVTDEVPYTFRTSGGSADIWNRETDMLIGGSVAWNQLVSSATFPNVHGENGVTVSWQNGAMTLSGTTNNTSWLHVYASTDIPADGHKYLAIVDNKPSDWRFGYIGGDGVMCPSSGTSNYIIFTNNLKIRAMNFRAPSGSASNFSCHPQLFDLTQLFGSTIADHIYALEQATAGAGVAWFKKLFPKPYYEYNAGELIHVNASEHRMVGFNQWDEEWEVGGIDTSTGQNITGNDRIRSVNYIPVLPNTTYFFNNGSGKTYSLRWYDSNKNFIGMTAGVTASSTYTTPNNCYYMRFICVETSYTNDICINLSWSGYRNGEYEPYEVHSYPLDSSLTLRGIPKLDADGNLYYDGDTYESDGKVTRKYGYVVFDGTESWAAWSITGTLKKTISGMIIQSWGYDIIPNTIRCSHLSVSTRRTIAEKTAFAISLDSGSQPNIVIYHGDQTASVSAWQSYLAAQYAAGTPVTLVYELATPTEETAEPYTNPQIVDDFGTEEYVVTEQSGVAVPVGHETFYQANLRDKLQHLPDLAPNNGTYCIQQTDNEMALVPLPAAVTELPDPPTSDGNFKLRCTVANGNVTYSWVAE